MSIFGSDVTQLSQPSGVSGGGSPVVDTSDVVAAQGVGQAFQQLGEGISDFFKIKSKQDELAAKQQAALQQDELVGDLAIDLSEVNEAVTAGALSRTQGSVQMERLTREAIASNPGQAETIIETYRKVTGRALVGESEAQKQRSATLQQAVSSGFLPPNQVGNIEAEDQGIAEWQQFKSSMAELQQAQALVNYENAKLTQAAKLSDAQKRISEANRDANDEKIARKFRDSTILAMPAMTRQLDQMLGQAQTPQEQDAVISQWQINAMNQAAGLAGDVIKAEEFNRFRTLVETVANNYRDFSKGTFTRQAMENENATILAADQRVALQDPAVREVTAQSRLLGNIINANPRLANVFANKVNHVFIQQKPPTREDSQEEGSELVKSVKYALPQTLSGIAERDDKVFEDAASVLNYTNQAVGDFRDQVSPNELSPMVTQMADPKFLDAVTARPQLMNKTFQQNATQVLEGHLRNTVLPTFFSEMENTKVANVPVSQVAQLEVSFDGIYRVVRKPAVGQVGAGTGIQLRVDQAIEDAIAKLNRDLVPVLNKWVMATAHANGDDNYRQRASLYLEGFTGRQVEEPEG